MRVRVVPMRRRGVPVPLKRLNTETGVTGELIVFEQRDEILRRTVRVAQIQVGMSVAARDLLPPLLDVSLLWMSTTGFTLGGFERIPLAQDGTTIDYAQSWWCSMQ